MSSKNRIVLFQYNFKSPVGALIMIGTRCMDTHCAVMVNGKYMHSSETESRFGEVDTSKFLDRDCIIYDLPEGSGTIEWARGMRNARYDWVGIAGWVMYWASFGRVYFDRLIDFFCFDTGVDYGHRCFGFPRPKKPYSGRAIRKMMKDAGIIGRTGKFGDLM